MSLQLQPQKPFRQNGDQLILVCPRCDCQWVHVRRAYALEGSDPFEGGSEHGELFGVPVGGITPCRRGALVIEAWGECNHCFELKFENERGETVIRIRNLEDRR